MKGICIQLISSIIISIGNFLNGYSTAWPSDALTAFMSDASPLSRPITSGEANLIASIPMLGGLASMAFSVWLSDTIGRKRATILTALGFVVAWSTIATAKNVPLILIARFIIGISCGLQLVVSIPYISELSETRLKGTNACFGVLLYLSGTLVAYVNGWLLSYQVISYFNLSLSVIFAVAISCWKETPAFLVKRGKEMEALESLMFYRGVSSPTHAIMEEFNYIKSQSTPRKGLLDNVGEEETNLREDTTIVGAKAVELSAWKTLCTSKSNRRALTLIILYTLLLVLGGTIAVIAYATPLFALAAPTLSSHVCSILLSIAFTVGCLTSTAVSGIIGIRLLTIFSAVLSSWCLGVLASLLRWRWGPEWLIPASMLAYCMYFQMGVGNVPFILLSVTFGPKIKSLASMIVFGLMNLGNFVVLALFNPLIDLLGLNVAFFLFAIICIATAIVSFFTMKETKGRTVEDIQKMYEQGWFYF